MHHLPSAGGRAERIRPTPPRVRAAEIRGGPPGPRIPAALLRDPAAHAHRGRRGPAAPLQAPAASGPHVRGRRHLHAVGLRPERLPGPDGVGGAVPPGAVGRDQVPDGADADRGDQEGAAGARDAGDAVEPVGAGPLPPRQRRGVHLATGGHVHEHLPARRDGSGAPGAVHRARRVAVPGVRAEAAAGGGREQRLPGFDPGVPAVGARGALDVAHPDGADHAAAGAEHDPPEREAGAGRRHLRARHLRHVHMGRAGTEDPAQRAGWLPAAHEGR